MRVGSLFILGLPGAALGSQWKVNWFAAPLSKLIANMKSKLTDLVTGTHNASITPDLDMFPITASPAVHTVLEA